MSLRREISLDVFANNVTISSVKITSFDCLLTAKISIGIRKKKKKNHNIDIVKCLFYVYMKDIRMFS